MGSDGRWHVLVTSTLLPTTRSALERAATVTIAPDEGADTLRRLAADVDVIVVRNRLPADIFEFAPRVLGAVRHGVGVDFIPVEAATAKGVVVANVPGANATSVAEYCVMQIMNLLRHPERGERLMREIGWEKARSKAPRGHELCGRSVGILGFGAIGSRLAHILHFGFEAKVVVCTRHPERLPVWAESQAVETLLSEVDVAVPCLPYTTETHHYLSATRLARLKPTAVIVNASRGAVIDEVALLRALSEGQLAGAALDVFEGASPQPGDALMATDNLMITPHMGGNTVDAHTRIGAECVAQVIQILNGECPTHFVNPQVWERYQIRRKDLGAFRTAARDG